MYGISTIFCWQESPRSRGCARKLIEQSVIEPTKRLSYPALQDIGVQKDLLVNDMLRASFPMLPKPVEAYQADWERELLRS